MSNAESGHEPGAVTTTGDAAALLAPKFFGTGEEVVAMLCLDNRRNPKFCDVLYEGSVNAVDVNIRLLMEKVLATKSVGVVLAHNHPNGIAIPSELDIATTIRLREYLRGHRRHACRPSRDGGRGLHQHGRKRIFR